MGRRRALRDQRGAGAQPGDARAVADGCLRHADGGGVARGAGSGVRALRTHPLDGRGLRLARGPRRRSRRWPTRPAGAPSAWSPIRSASTATRFPPCVRPPRSANTPTRCWASEHGRRTLARGARSVGDPAGADRRRPGVAVSGSRPSSSVAVRRARHRRADSPSTCERWTRSPRQGPVLDVGSGGGSISLPLAGRASHLTAVDEQADMLAAFAEAARAAGVEASTILGRWPDVAGEAPTADVVTCGHVAYNVADLGPFVSALDAHAGRRVVMELTDRHPLAWMNDLWLTFHGLVRPDGPTDADAVDVDRATSGLAVGARGAHQAAHGGRRRVRASRGCDRARPAPPLPAGGPRRRRSPRRWASACGERGGLCGRPGRRRTDAS